MMMKMRNKAAISNSLQITNYELRRYEGEKDEG
jgi:hypothetical protein